MQSPCRSRSLRESRRMDRAAMSRFASEKCGGSAGTKHTCVLTACHCVMQWNRRDERGKARDCPQCAAVRCFLWNYSYPIKSEKHLFFQVLLRKKIEFWKSDFVRFVLRRQNVRADRHAAFKTGWCKQRRFAGNIWRSIRHLNMPQDEVMSNDDDWWRW